MADPNKDVIGKIEPFAPLSFFESRKEIINKWANLKSPQSEICGECNFLNFCVPCPLRVRRLFEGGFIDRKKCIWYNTVDIF